MKLELSYDEVSTICQALWIRAQEATRNALECERFGEKREAKLWRESAEEYRKLWEAVEAQREEYEQAVAALKEE